jgi:catechol 2,3-dioxygenase-like lactoylglutathione lyase family enzyme
MTLAAKYNRKRKRKMTSMIVTHLTVGALNVQKSIDFYIDLLGRENVEVLPLPNLGGPTVEVAWLRFGPLQLHIGQRSTLTRDLKDHFGIGIADKALFHDIYARAKAGGYLQPEAFAHHIYELPGGDVQMYLKDPAGNTVEIDFPDATQIDRSIITDMRRMADRWPQPEEASRASLFDSLSGRALLKR